MNQKNITYQEKLDELILDIKNPNSNAKIFVLLEGESDLKLFGKLFLEEYCKIELIPGGKFKLEECVEELLKHHHLIIGIRDADFIHLDGSPYGKKNVFLTDFHDMEMVLISTNDLFNALASEFTGLPQNSRLVLRNEILTTIENIGYLKWLNEKETLELTFEAGFQDLLSFEDHSLNFEEYFSRIIAKSPNAKISDCVVIQQKIELLQSLEPNLFHLCNGHDFFKAFLQYINQHQNAKRVNDQNIVSSCRMFYGINHYQSTALYQSTKQWADNNNCVIY